MRFAFFLFHIPIFRFDATHRQVGSVSHRFTVLDLFEIFFTTCIFFLCGNLFFN